MPLFLHFFFIFQHITRQRLCIVFSLLFSYGTYALTVDDRELQHKLDSFRLQSGIPAAVLTVNYPNHTSLNFVSGSIKIKTDKNKNPKPVTKDNLFQIGSITKSFTAAIILQLEAEGKLGINETIAETVKKYGQWLPNEKYQAWKNITIKQLLNMTNGIYDVVDNKHFLNALAQNPQKQWSPQELLHYTDNQPPYFAPGTRWRYSNTSYNILGLLVEAVTKHSFEYEIQQRIIKPFELHNTFYLPYPYPQHIIQRMAHGYVYTNGEFSPPMQSGTDMTFFNMSAAGPSGALVSNSNDIARWVRLLFSGRILHGQQLAEMLTAVCMGQDSKCKPGDTLSSDSQSLGFSLGLTRMYDTDLGVFWFYFGSTPGYYSSFLWLPKEKIVLALTLSGTTTEAKKSIRFLVSLSKFILNTHYKGL